MDASSNGSAGRIAGPRRTDGPLVRRVPPEPVHVLPYLLSRGSGLVSDEIIVRELLEILERRRRARFPLELVP